LAKTCVSCGHSLLDFQRICERCGTIQPEKYQPTQKPAQVSVPPPTLPEQASPTEIPRPEPQPEPPSPAYTSQRTGRNVRVLILASVLIVVVVVGVVVAAALLRYNPFASLSTNGTSCTITTANASGCTIGNNLYVTNLHVSNSSYSNHATYLVAFVINNTGTAPVNITTINLDNGPVLNALPSPGSNVTSPFWQSYIVGHVIGSKAQLQFALQLPLTTSTGAHKITLLDTAGKSYTFSFNIS